MKNSSTALIALLIPKIGYQATKNMLKNVNLFYFSSKEEGEKIKGGEFKQRCHPYNKFFVTSSDDIHVDSVSQVTKFGKDIKTGRWKTKKTS
jgi:hypothetical protein